MLKLNVRVGQSIAIGGPTTVRVEAKSGQEVALVFDADRSVPIRIINDTPQAARGAVGLGRGEMEQSASPGLGRVTAAKPPAHDGPALIRRSR